MLEAIKYLPAIAYDVLTWAILKRLDATSRRKIKVNSSHALSVRTCLMTADLCPCR